MLNTPPRRSGSRQWICRGGRHGRRAMVIVGIALLAMSFAQTGQAGQQTVAESRVRSEHDKSAQHRRLWGERSPFNQRISKHATYTLEARIGTVRNVYDGWSMPIYRIAPAAVPPVKCLHRESGRIVNWPIPRSARPAPKDDAHLGVMVPSEGVIYEFWAAEWQPDGSLEAGGFSAFPLNGTGISDPPQYRTTASGFAVSAGMVVREDVINPATGDLDADFSIDHALAIALHARLCGITFVPPAVRPELKCTGDIPMGALLALPPDADVENLEIHPFAKAVARALRDYGAYVNDGRLGDNYKDKEVAVFRVEPGLLEEVFGQSNSALTGILAKDMYDVIARYGLYRVTNANGR